MLKKLDKILKITIVTGISIFLLAIVIITVLKDVITEENTYLVEGNIDNIDILKTNRMWHPSYRIKLKNSNSLYKISPEFNECFNFIEFRHNVKENELIKIRVDKDEGIKFKSIKSAVSIIVRDKEYIDTACLNETIKKDKIELPLLMGFLVFVLLPIIYFGNKFYYKKFK